MCLDIGTGLLGLERLVRDDINGEIHVLVSCGRHDCGQDESEGYGGTLLQLAWVDAQGLNGNSMLCMLYREVNTCYSL